MEELIGFFPNADPPKGQGTGTQVAPPSIEKKSIQDQLNEVNAKLRDPKIPYGEKSKLIDLSIQLNRKIQKGET